MIDAVALDREVQRQRTVYQRMKVRRRDIDGGAAAQRRRDEAAVREDKRKALGIYAGMRERFGPARTPVSLLVWRQREVLEALASERPVPPHVAREFDHLRALCRRGGITVATGADHQNGYSWRTRKRIEIPAHQSMWTAATLAHEAGHVFNPTGSTKVRCELDAWAWARRHMVTWDRECHENQHSALRSYRSQGTPAEQAEIDRVVSRRAFNEERQRRLMTGEARWRT
jgi:hypothetical protein